MSEDTLYIIIPAYNESSNIDRVVSDWYSVIDGIGGESRLVIIDDGSKDNTYDLLLKLQESHPLLIPLTKPNGGHGSTVLYGYDYAIKNNADFVFQTDSDGQTDAKEFAAFWDERDSFDAIIGTRTHRGDGKIRKLVENVACFLLRLYFGIKVKDANAPFRLMRTSILSKYMGRFAPDYNLPNIMLTTFFVYYDEKVLFKEISFKPRQGGKNSINLRRIVRIGWNALKDFSNFKKGMKK